MKLKYLLEGIKEAIKIHGGEMRTGDIVDVPYLGSMTVMEAAMVYAEGAETTAIEIERGPECPCAGCTGEFCSTCDALPEWNKATQKDVRN